MHIPDGYLSAATVAGTYALTGATAVLASKKIKKSIDEERIPIYGVAAALIFAAQMINFPVLNGTSGHLIGGLLAALIAGPWGGFFIMASVLIVQSLLFADGGITALGANIFNMAFIGSTITYFIYAWLTKNLRSKKIAVFLSSWLSVFLAATACAFELWISGRSLPQLIFPSMLGIHSLIGIGEAIITAGVVEALNSVRPDIFFISLAKGGGEIE
ncbi:MAG: energy-coupling factor ABC transporter permease [Actinobacteria bacterium]|nr:energy-coupling factor ABC transporter permease [Actinomycetota bacterium]